MAQSSDLSSLTYSELLERIRSLEQKNLHLRGLVLNLQPNLEREKKFRKKIDFSRFSKRRIALKILYMGWDYSGIVPQDLNKFTVAEKLKQAFQRCQMLEDVSDCGFAVCGRTDKGVSALSQVVTMVLRSNVNAGIGVIPPVAESELYPEKPEIDFVYIGNKNLPKDIRILAWAPAPLEFTPRHSCISRSYKYFFPASHLDLELMDTSAQRLLGEHDFRNFCTSQVSNGVLNYKRTILSINIDNLNEGISSGDPQNMCCLTICGTAFLYHQIRCMVSILLSIGRGLEPPEIIDDLLDIHKTPAKPTYQMAAPEPLLFYEPEFDCLDWQTSEAASEDIVKNLHRSWTEQSVRCQITKTMLDYVEHNMFPTCEVNNYMKAICAEAPSSPSATRRPILKRPFEITIEEKIKKFELKKIKENTDRVSDESENSEADDAVVASK